MNQEKEQKKEDGSKLLISQGSSYTEKKHVLEEVTSSAYVFLIVGILGILGLILIWLDVVKLQLTFYTKGTSTVVMGTLFIVFIFVGLKSIFSIKTLQQESSLEQTRTEEITQWVLTHYTLEQLDSMLDLNELSMEQLFFIRTEKIAELIRQEFDLLEENYLDFLVEKIYQIYSPDE